MIKHLLGRARSDFLHRNRSHWFVFWPAALVMTIVGMITGPKKGCFVWMAAVFIGLPILLFILLFIIGFLGAMADSM